MTHDNATELLRTIVPFDKLSSDRFSQLAAIIEWKEYRRGQAVYLEGDPADRVMVIVEGSVEVYHVSKDGAELRVDELTSPALFGDADALAGGARRENASAASAAFIGAVPAALLLELIKREPEAAVELLLSGARRLSRASAKQKSMAFDPIPKRAAQFLLECAQRNNPPSITQPRISVTQDLIANAVGATRRSIASAMSEWQARGIIVRMAKGYEIADLNAFVRLAS